tara:strand:- start:1538 stop:2122 length:585 start_codon:yes stop_codon:yes gene_type:complete
MSTWQKYKALGNLEKFGVAMGAAGALGGAYGAFAGARSEKLRTKSLALQLKHKEDMMRFNIKQNESQAQWLNQVFNKQYQIATLKQGNKKSTAKTSFAARGIQMGVGSTKDVFVSSEVLNAVENLTMNSNKVRAITNQRLKGVGMGIKADMTGLSADFKNMTAASIDPFMSMTSSFMSGSSNFISNLPESLLTK